MYGVLAEPLWCGSHCANPDVIFCTISVIREKARSYLTTAFQNKREGSRTAALAQFFGKPVLVERFTQLERFEHLDARQEPDDAHIGQ